VFLLVFDSLVGFMLYTRLLESAPAPLVSTYAYVTPLVGAVIGATVLGEALWAGAFVGGALVLGAVALELRGPMRPRPSRWDGREHRPGATESHTPHIPDHLRRSLHSCCTAAARDRLWRVMARDLGRGMIANWWPLMDRGACEPRWCQELATVTVGGARRGG
jgi:hypothetical protein